MSGDERGVQLPKRLQDKVGVEVYREIEALKVSVDILKGNYEVLINEHDKYRTKSIEEWGEINVLRLLKENYFRPLHNYIASVYTLISHSQRIVNKFGGTDYSNQYSDELSEREIDRKGEFLGQLRHYTQKRKVPPIEASFVMKAEEDHELTLHIRKDLMVDWDGWNQSAREYLETLDDRVPLRQEIKKYQDEVEDFYDWFYKYTELYFDEEYREVAEIIEEIEEEKPDSMVYPVEYHVPFDADDFR